MKLYYIPGVCSLSPHIVLRELGLDVELSKVDLASKTLPDGSAYDAINPKSYVPALLRDDGELMTEGAIIVQWLADQHPQAGLAPAPGTPERWRLNALLNFIGSEIHKGYAQLAHCGDNQGWRDYAAGVLHRRIGLLAETLRTQPYLGGDRFSIADAYFFTCLSWSDWLKVDLSAWPQLAEYRARIKARPAVQAALKAEGLPA